MLVSLSIRNLALIEEISLSFHDGLHVLTGETGAGKSIVVDALNLVVGERADRDLIRAGCERASVEAVMDVSRSEDARNVLSAQGLLPEDGLLTVYRDISQTGRNVCRVNGVLVQLAVLKDVTRALVDIHGQHAHQSLLDEQHHLSFLDAFGDDAHASAITDTATAYTAFKRASRAFSQARKEGARLRQRAAEDAARAKELNDAKLQAGEEERLSREWALLRSAERVSETLSAASEAVYADGGEDAAARKAREASDLLRRVAELDPEYEKLADRLRALAYELEEAGRDLRAMRDAAAYDPERAERVAERLDFLRKLQKKHALDEAGLIALRDALARDVRDAADDSRERELERAFKESLRAYRACAAALSDSRDALARTMETRMGEQLADLGMKGARFIVRVTRETPVEKRVPAEKGDDAVCFFIAPNPGEPEKPLAKTASGGELSRIMLALKALAADRNRVPCMIFDEVDAGISGRVAGVVARKMADIAAYRQVICVTHLPQIAVMADAQYIVEKGASGARTRTVVRELDAEGREGEIARLVGAEEGHMESGLAHARELLRDAAAYRREIGEKRDKREGLPPNPSSVFI